MLAVALINPSGDISNVLVSHLNTEGSLDASFTTAGIAINSYEYVNHAYDLAELDDGALLVAGSTGVNPFFTYD